MQSHAYSHSCTNTLTHRYTHPCSPSVVSNCVFAKHLCNRTAVENAGKGPGELNTTQLIPFDSTRITVCKCVHKSVSAFGDGREREGKRVDECWLKFVLCVHFLFFSVFLFLVCVSLCNQSPLSAFWNIPQSSSSSSSSC